MLLEVLPNALGAAVWSAQLEGDSFAKTCIQHGVIPILSRFVIEGTPGPFGVAKPLGVTGRFQLAQGEERVFLNMWGDLTGPIGRVYPPKPDDAGTIASAGRIFGEHVFTRLFAPPGERRVNKLDVPGAPESLAPYVQRAFASMLDLPSDAKALDAVSPDDAPVVFGVVHTDSNQHVNSLVYLRVFEELALRRFAALGRRDAVLSRKLEIAYRKPCFAGDRVRVALRAFEHQGAVGLVGELAPAAGGAPHCSVRIVFG